MIDHYYFFNVDIGGNRTGFLFDSPKSSVEEAVTLWKIRLGIYGQIIACDIVSNNIGFTIVVTFFE